MTTATDLDHAPTLTSDGIWRALDKASFAVISYVTPEGEPRSSGVVYELIGERLYVAVDPGSWKARHIPRRGRVSMTVTVRRGGILSLVIPIPPATITFSGAATVHLPGSSGVASVLDRLGSLLPEERRVSAAIIEVVPEGSFVTYGIGVPLREMRDPAAARARVPVR